MTQAFVEIHHLSKLDEERLLSFLLDPENGSLLAPTGVTRIVSAPELSPNALVNSIDKRVLAKWRKEKRDAELKQQLAEMGLPPVNLGRRRAPKPKPHAGCVGFVQFCRDTPDARTELAAYIFAVLEALGIYSEEPLHKRYYAETWPCPTLIIVHATSWENAWDLMGAENHAGRGDYFFSARLLEDRVARYQVKVRIVGESPVRPPFE